MSGRFCTGKAAKRNCLSEFEMVYGNIAGSDGADQFLLESVSQSAHCRLQDHRICVECPVGHEMQRRNPKSAASMCRQREGTG